ncbi:hypothetical protein JX001_16165 [Brevundimonas fontaquae]|uniref:Uncharacterized protein n=1 Tax=Brevundimonas fontaquae TaxID=2813778 RepID=A0ABX7LQT4_9CAUL|nr:hypothetical protein JX001_16165 [Brevundimonas fontaquae]
MVGSVESRACQPRLDGVQRAHVATVRAAGVGQALANDLDHADGFDGRGRGVIEKRGLCRFHWRQIQLDQQVLAAGGQR